jgi:hypothetical protein
MDGDDEIDSLIAEWESLRIRATVVVELLEAAQARRSNRPTPVASASVQVPRGPTINGFARGDRVRIKNKVNKPASWPAARVWDKDAARFATITEVTREQIHFVTDKGVRTWRAHNNLERVVE